MRWELSLLLKKSLRLPSWYYWFTERFLSISKAVGLILVLIFAPRSGNTEVTSSIDLPGHQVIQGDARATFPLPGSGKVDAEIPWNQEMNLALFLLPPLGCVRVYMCMYLHAHVEKSMRVIVSKRPGNNFFILCVVGKFLKNLKFVVIEI